MEHRHFIYGKADELLHVVDASHFLERNVALSDTPFQKTSILRVFKKWVYKSLVSFTKRILGEKLYVENQLGELILTDPPTRSLLNSLISRGLVSSWTVDNVSGYEPYIEAVTLYLGNIVSSSGRRVKFMGNAVHGVGRTLNEAFIPALAEFYERYATTQWPTNKICHASYNKLRHRNALDPQSFNCFTESQFDSVRQARNISSLYSDADASLGWIRSRSLITGRYHYVPAQLVFLYYYAEHSHEPFLSDTTTNGVAAHTDFEIAAYKAVCEVVERDSFLIHWLNRITPLRVRLNSIQNEEIQELVAHICSQNLELWVLNITSDFEIPAFVSLIRRPKDGLLVIGGSAGLNVTQSVRKSILEAARMMQFNSYVFSQETFHRLEQSNFLITNFSERRTFWALRERERDLRFFLEGQEVDFESVFNVGNDYEDNVQLNELRTLFRKKGKDCFCVDITCKEAASVGLKIAKALIPETVPIYFDERLIPLRSKRIFSAPRLFGHEAVKTIRDLNTLPHPFL